MKKIINLILVVIACFACFFTLTACDEDVQGKSAYELAVENGFEGTQEEWLDSLRGTNGTNGTNGTDGQKGLDGVDGTNAKLTASDLYEEAKNQGFEGTFLEFVEAYCNVSVTTDNRNSIATSLLSSVSIICEHRYMSYGWNFEQTEQKGYSYGSGVIYQMNKSEGSAYIITNYHVVYEATSLTETHISDNINILLYGSEYSDQSIKATYVGGSMNYDIAVLYVNKSEILKNSEARSIDFADSIDVVVGQKAIAIGNPETDGISVTEGIVSVDSENISMYASDGETYVTFRVMRIDTAVNSGNSGGGLFNSEGKLIGIVNAKVKKDGVEGIAYALPSNVVKNVVENILYYKDAVGGGVVKKCMLGVTVTIEDSKAVYDETSDTVHKVEKAVVIEEYDEKNKVDTRIKEGALVYGYLKDGDVIKAVKIDRNADGIAEETYQITRSYMIVDLMLTMRVGEKLVLVIDRTENDITTEKEFTFSMTEECIQAFN